MKQETIYRDAAIYCRVSTEDQSCDRQERDLKEFAQRAGYRIVGTYKEVASGKRTDRQERAKVMALAQARRVQVVLVTELTRWGRSTLDLLSTLQTLNSYGVSVVAQTGAQFDLSTAQGKMIAGVLAVLAQFERDLIAERTKSGLALAVAKGKTLGRPRGDRTTAKHRQAVLDLRASGFSYREIAHKLRISTETIGRIARRERVTAKSKT